MKTIKAQVEIEYDVPTDLTLVQAKQELDRMLFDSLQSVTYTVEYRFRIRSIIERKSE